MRGQISDQDLTNYALNDGLAPQERLYVESMLAISAECRDDVYRGLELAQMLETGFERGMDALPSLTDEQRATLLCPPRRIPPMTYVHRAAATLALAACVAFAFANPTLWQAENRRRSLASVSSHVSQMAARLSVQSDSGLAPLVHLPNLGDEVDSLMQTASESFPQAMTICTPPTLDSAAYTDSAELR